MTVQRQHRMPFGAELTADGGVRFRIWAPAARRMQLLLYDGTASPRALDMQALPDGWFELITDAASAGSRYHYRMEDGLVVPDPASRYSPDDVHGPSQVVDPTAFEWNDTGWAPPRWHEAVICELHVGTITLDGTFAGLETRLDHFANVGVSVLELMPIADFPGKRGWGYDGVLPFAPEATYGSPETLKKLIAAAHKRGIAVVLDVVYNHLGPDGNYLGKYAPQFFTDRHKTPWGQAINFDGPDSRTVRDFFVHNALFWLEEYHFDGLRLDAVHAIRDDSELHIVTEIAQRVRAGPGRDRRAFLVLENVRNQAFFLGPEGGRSTADGQWNDDLHHCLHVILTGESDGYYADYPAPAHGQLSRCLSEGFAYQGEWSQYRHGPRGEPSARLPPSAFVNFLQNHDQIGNRAYGDRLCTLAASPAALHAAQAILLLAPQPPMLFMGEEWGARQPFPYFCDFPEPLASAVRDGRRREFAHFRGFRDEQMLARIPDPTEAATYLSALLDWDDRDENPHAQVLERFRNLLAIRRERIIPIIPEIRAGKGWELAPGGIGVDWSLAGGETLMLRANLSEQPISLPGVPTGNRLYETHPADPKAELPAWSVIWLLERSGDGG
jgi:malto-oligosyltrehalose trehalohydrolase